LAVILWGASVGAFHIFRNIGLSPDAFTVAAGGALIALSGAATIALPVDGGLARGFSALLAAAASLVTVYSVARWATRRWYITVARRVNRAAETRLRALVLWTRRQHGLFGWVILATATAHAVYFLPHLAQAPTLRVVTGVCAWILLTCLIAIGMYISRRAKAGRPVRGMRPVHVGLAVAFVVALLVHV
jgi:hypothetical protein